MDISIVVPTYNEKDNITVLLDRTIKSLEYLNCKDNGDIDKTYKYEILVIDDNSPDGTSDIVEQYKLRRHILSERYKNISNNNITCIVRKNERGLASAVVEGFKNARGDIIVVMDADLQHPPEKIVSMIKEINNGNDIVIGSRYIEENGFGNFNIFRKIMSKSANIPAKILFSELRNIKDVQSGFFAIRKEVIDGIKLNPFGYKILLEILIKSTGSYNKVKEIPFEFNKRKYGNTKLGSKVIMEYLYHLMLLYWKKNNLNRFVKFCLVGMTGIFVNMLLLYIFTDILKVFYLFSAIVAYEFSIISNFIFNDIWTFKDCIIPGKSHSLLVRAIHFNWTRASGAILSISMLYILTEFLYMNYLLSNLIGIAVGTLWSYISSVNIVWRIDKK